MRLPTTPSVSWRAEGVKADAVGTGSYEPAGIDGRKSPEGRRGGADLAFVSETGLGKRYQPNASCQYQQRLARRFPRSPQPPFRALVWIVVPPSSVEEASVGGAPRANPSPRPGRRAPRRGGRGTLMRPCLSLPSSVPCRSLPVWGSRELSSARPRERRSVSRTPGHSGRARFKPESNEPASRRGRSHPAPEAGGAG